MADLLTLPTFALTKEGRPLPDFDTVVQGSPSGVEARAGRRTVPRYRVTLSLELRTWVNHASTGQSEDATFVGFFLAVGGKRDSFLYTGKDGIPRRWRFDEDGLAEFSYRGGTGGGVYSGDIDLVSVVA